MGHPIYRGSDTLDENNAGVSPIGTHSRFRYHLRLDTCQECDELEDLATRQTFPTRARTGRNNGGSEAMRVARGFRLTPYDILGLFAPTAVPAYLEGSQDSGGTEGLKGSFVFQKRHPRGTDRKRPFHMRETPRARDVSTSRGPLFFLPPPRPPRRRRRRLWRFRLFRFVLCTMPVSDHKFYAAEPWNRSRSTIRRRGGKPPRKREYLSSLSIVFLKSQGNSGKKQKQIRRQGNSLTRGKASSHRPNQISNSRVRIERRSPKGSSGKKRHLSLEREYCPRIRESLNENRRARWVISWDGHYFTEAPSPDDDVI